MSTTPDSTTSTTGTERDDAHEPVGHDDAGSTRATDERSGVDHEQLVTDEGPGHDEGAVNDEERGNDEQLVHDVEPVDEERDSDEGNVLEEEAAADEQSAAAEGDDSGELPESEGASSHPTSRDRTEDLVREGEIAADFLEALLDIADLAGDLEVDIEGNRAAVAIVDSEDGVAPRRLVGPGGAVLDALQELTRLAVQAETGERSRLMLDVAGYRSDRRSALVKTARRAIEEVKESGSARELEPMTAFERKVVHDEVLAAGLRSESAGVEPSRYVVIQPSA